MPDFSGFVMFRIRRHDLESCRNPGAFSRQLLYEEYVDPCQRINWEDDFMTGDRVVLGHVDESRWPLCPTVLG